MLVVVNNDGYCLYNSPVTSILLGYTHCGWLLWLLRSYTHSTIWHMVSWVSIPGLDSPSMLWVWSMLRGAWGHLTLYWHSTIHQTRSQWGRQPAVVVVVVDSSGWNCYIRQLAGHWLVTNTMYNRHTCGVRFSGREVTSIPSMHILSA